MNTKLQLFNQPLLKSVKGTLPTPAYSLYPKSILLQNRSSYMKILIMKLWVYKCSQHGNPREKVIFTHATKCNLLP